MDNPVILSICIPTNGVVEWVIPAVKSIYEQGVDNSLFEVVITDNGDQSDLSQALESYDYPNLNYYRNQSQGFTNQIDAFEKCQGLFCKMLNHRSRLLPGSLNKLIDLVNKYKAEKPILYCAEGKAYGDEFVECENTDEFVRRLSFWASWSAGVGAWRSDLEAIRTKTINPMFPHTVFLFGLRDESKYVIWNEKYEIMASDTGKGGYDLFKAFGVIFPDILNHLRLLDKISCETFLSVKKDLYKFLCSQYLYEVLLPTEHTFIIRNIAQSMGVYWGKYDYWKMIVWSLLNSPWALIQRYGSKIYRNTLKKGV